MELEPDASQFAGGFFHSVQKCWNTLSRNPGSRVQLLDYPLLMHFSILLAWEIDKIKKSFAVLCTWYNIVVLLCFAIDF